MLWILLFWVIWEPLEAIGTSGWPRVLRAITMGAVVAVASGAATYLDRRVLHYDGSLTKFSVSRIGIMAMSVTVVLTLAFDSRTTLAPWLMALILLALIVVIAIFKERARRPEQKPAPQAK